MGWGDNESYYDEIEWKSIDWLKVNLPSYLALHEQSAGHLPGNFASAYGTPLGKTHVAAQNIRRTGNNERRCRAD